MTLDDFDVILKPEVMTLNPGFLAPQSVMIAKSYLPRSPSKTSNACHSPASPYDRGHMKWFSASAAVLFLASNLAVLAGPDEDYISIYQQIEEADRLAAGNQTGAARQRYAQIQEALKKFKAANPAWNERTVDYRLEYVTERLRKLGGGVPESAPKPAVAPAPTTAPADPTAPLRAQIAQLQEERKVLSAKLEEALKAQPAAVDPRELQKAQTQISDLQKEKELLKVALDQEQAKTAKAADKSGLEEAQKQIANLKSQLAASAAPATATDRELNAARETLRTNALTIAALQTALTNMRQERDAILARSSASDKSTATAAPTSAGANDSKLKQLEAERDDLAKQLASAKLELAVKTPQKGASPDKESRQLAILRARLEALEARKVPYTPEELALFNKTPLAGKAPPTDNKTKKKELPPGAGAILTDAQRAFAAKRYDEAEQAYLKVLKMDEKNVFTLGNLGAIQMEMGRLNDAETTLAKAQSIDPTDGFILSTLGILRFRQNKFDEAQDLLSRAVDLDPKNYEAYNYLGITLSQKGQRTAAESALRRAIEINPAYAGAHYNLAVVYATQQPPFAELAKFHYDKAVSLGHPASPEVEKMIASAKK
jgi:tetratricopeptide (TPR) repeat protein